MIAIVLGLILSTASAQPNFSKIESDFRTKAFEMTAHLEKQQPRDIYLDDMKLLIKEVEIEVTEDELYFDNEKKDAVNLFPRTKKIILYAKRWRQFLNSKDENAFNLIYHELIPFFTGNDIQYIESRSKDFKRFPKVLLANFISGVYEYNNSPMVIGADSCLHYVKADPQNRTVSLSLTHKNKEFCPYTTNPPIVYFCSSDYGTSCLRQEGASSSTMSITLLSSSKFEYNWFFGDEKPGDRPPFAIYSLLKDYKQPAVTVFWGSETKRFNPKFYDNASACFFAYRQALSQAMNRCQTVVELKKLSAIQKPGSCVEQKVITRPEGNRGEDDYDDQLCSVAVEVVLEDELRR